MPFDEDMMTLIMGVGGPEEPGQHGRTKTTMPTTDAVSVVTQIRDLCEEFLMGAGKEDEDKPMRKEKPKGKSKNFNKDFGEDEEDEF